MDNLKNKNGISLVSVVVTIIVLIILSGVALVFDNRKVIDKTVLATAKTAEVMLEEQIELAWVEAKATHIVNTENPQIELEENFHKELARNLEEIYHFENVSVTVENDLDVRITLTYKNEIFNFLVTSNGKASLTSKEKVEPSKPLKGNVKIGDYIEYPIEYTDMYSERNYTKSEAWRIIDDGVMKGTSGYVKIICAGIPVKLNYYHENSEALVDDLLNRFEEMEFLDNSNSGRKVKGSSFKVEDIANKVTTLSLNDLNRAYNALYQTNRRLDDTSKIDDKHKLIYLTDDEMFMYLLSTRKEDTNLGIYYVTNEGIDYYMEDIRIGIRPVIYLNDGLEGKLENNIWKIIN